MGDTYGHTAESLMKDLDEMTLHFAGAAVVLHFCKQYTFLVFHDEDCRCKKLTDLLCGAGLPAGFIAWKDAGDKAMFMLVPLPEYANDEDAQLYLTQVLESILPRLPSFFTVRPPADSIFVLSLVKPALGTGQISDS